MARVLLDAGITTVRDVGGYGGEAIVLRQAIDLGIVPGPRILSCGRILSATSPGAVIFGTMYRAADGPWEMRKAVREQIRDGADYIKIMATGARSVVREDPEPAQMTRDEVAAVVDEAHRMGYRVAAHAEGLGGARIAVEEGVDTIEHGLSLHRAPELLALMAERGIVLVPTLSTFVDLAERFADDFPPRLVEQAKRQADDAHATLRAAHAAGVTLAMGYDSGPPARTRRARPDGRGRHRRSGRDPGGDARVGTGARAGGRGRDRRGRPDRRPARARRRSVADPAILLDPARRWLVLQARPVVGGEGIGRRRPLTDERERRRLAEGALLWEPSEAFREASTLADYIRWLARERGLHFDDYAALWRWSVDDLEGFWTSIVDYYDLPLRGDRSRVLADATMPGANWFEGAELNYAEALLKRLAPDRPALLFASEREPLREMGATSSWRRSRRPRPASAGSASAAATASRP